MISGLGYLGPLNWHLYTRCAMHGYRPLDETQNWTVHDMDPSDDVKNESEGSLYGRGGEIA